MSVEVLLSPPTFLFGLIIGCRILAPVLLFGVCLYRYKAQMAALTLTAWMLASFIIGASDAYQPYWIPFLAFTPPLMLWALRTHVRRYFSQIPVAWLIGLQAFRCLGAMFVLLWLQGLFPAYFALPVGLGDLVVGLGAISLWLLHRQGRCRASWLWLWCVFGIADHLLAIALGSWLMFDQLDILTQAGKSAQFFPINLLPIFVVPFSICLHLLLMWRILDKTIDVPREI